MIFFDLLTGFLGSGKTTLLVDFLRRPEGADTAVIVNEAGEIDIDGAVIAADAGGLPMALLANGCVCCSVGNDLLYTIEALLAAREQSSGAPFRRIVLETSGLARPGPIIRSLGELAPLGMRLGIIATCDAAAEPFGEGVFEVAAAQLAAAGTIVLTKLDRADGAAPAARLAAINPLARLVMEEDPGRRAVAAFAGEAGVGASAGAALPVGHPRISVLTARIGAVALDEVLEWLDNLGGLAGERLLRLKGVLQPSDVAHPVLFQAVGTAFSQPVAFRGSSEFGLVIIVQDLTAAEIAAMQPGFPVVLTARGNDPFRRPAAPLLAR